jgi:hypothetical protein
MLAAGLGIERGALLVTGGTFAIVVVVTGTVVVGVGATVVVVTGSIVVVECVGVVVGVGNVVGVTDVDETCSTDDSVRDVVAT